MALLRAVAADEETAKRLFAAMQEGSVEMYRHILTDPKLEERVASVGAHLIGVTFSRFIFRSGPWPRCRTESSPAISFPTSAVPY